MSNFLHRLEERISDQFGDKLQAELSAYEKLSQLGLLMPKLMLYDQDQEVLLKEYIEGPTVYELVLGQQLDDRYVHQMHEICRVLYSANINIDYFPTNFVVRRKNCIT